MPSSGLIHFYEKLLKFLESNKCVNALKRADSFLLKDYAVIYAREDRVNALKRADSFLPWSLRARSTSGFQAPKNEIIV